MTVPTGLFLLLVLLSSLPAWADDPAALLAEHYLTKTPVQQFDSDLSFAEASAIQEQLVTILAETLGPSVGYKAGLTSAVAQKRFGVAHPLRGILLQNMLLANGSTVSISFGAVPLYEGDLLVRVSDHAINQATTPEQVLASLDAVIPFIELPDLIFGQSVELDAPALVAVNVGARLGVMGDPIALEATPEWQDRLGNFRLEVVDDTGRLLAEGTGSNLLGHPLNVVLWLKDSLINEGKFLRAGDLLSLGSITRLMPVTPNTTIKVRYGGLNPEDSVEVVVHFEGETHGEHDDR